MPIGVNGIELLRYFRQPESAFGKSIQRNWQFYGLFLHNPLSDKFKASLKSPITRPYSLGYLNNDFPPIIQSFHILDVSVPTYQFQKEVMMYGQVPRSFPVLDFKGFNFDITLEEDEQGTVEYFINWNQRNIIDSNGYYNAPEKMKMKAFVLEIQDKMGIPVVYYTFHDIYFLQATAASYSYSNNESIKRTITFGCDVMSTIFTKQNAVARGIGLLGGTAKGIKNAFNDRG